jgi:threonine/homoserine/homoserine lactone efflux protein
MASTFIMGLSNPMTFFIFLAIFAKMGIEVNAEDFVNNIWFVLSILSGSCILWIIVTNIIKLSKKSFDINVIIIIDKIIGTLIFLFGVFNLFKGVRKV